MDKNKINRNDPCYCGSGKKYKQCCLKKDSLRGLKKHTAKIIQSGSTKEISPVEKYNHLMERAFGGGIAAAQELKTPPLPKEPPPEKNS
jgi:hypothetical protein